MIKIKDYQKKLLKICALENTKEFNFNKALEESSEFSEALLKYQTKADSNPSKPTKKDILGEYSDFIYRGLISIKTLYPNLTLEEIEEKINNHILKKLEKMEEWERLGTYKNGL
jgi:hypothetical protein